MDVVVLVVVVASPALEYVHVVAVVVVVVVVVQPRPLTAVRSTEPSIRGSRSRPQASDAERGSLAPAAGATSLARTTPVLVVQTVQGTFGDTCTARDVPDTMKYRM